MGRVLAPTGRFQWKLRHKGLLLVCLPLFFELIFILVLSLLLWHADAERSREARSKAIITCASDLIALTHNVTLGPEAYLFSGNVETLKRYNLSLMEIPNQFARLRGLVGNDRFEQGLIDEAEASQNSAIEILARYRESVAGGDKEKLLNLVQHSGPRVHRLMDQITHRLMSLVAMEGKAVLAGEENESENRQSLIFLLLAGTAINIGLAIYMSLYFSRNVVERLETVMDNSARLARGESLHDPVGGGDEIARMDELFHAMAAALADSAQKERAIIENTLDVIFSLDASHRFTKVSPASVKLWGFAPAELAEKSCLEIIHEDDREKTRQAMAAATTGSSTLSFENRMLRKDGKTVNVLWSLHWSQSENSMFCVAHDITRRKQAEDQLKASEARVRSVIDSMPAGLIIVNPAGAVESANPKAETMFGYSRYQLTGRNLLELFHQPGHDNFDSFLFAVTVQAAGRSEWLVRKKDGRTFPIELSINELSTAEGQRYLAILIDVSELREVDRLKREFVSMVSHELRTPLTAIRGSLSMVAAGVLGQLPEKADRAIKTAERNTVRLIALINDILDLQRIESSKLEMSFTDVALCEVIDRSLDSVRSIADESGIRIEAGETDLKVVGDEGRLIQVVVNLLSNAIKFSDPGGMVRVSVAKVGSFVRVEIEDSGRGIPDEHKERIFETFQQVDKSDSREKGGTGLGLAICRAIVLQHGGEIGVESSPGAGSTFWFSVPAPAQASGGGSNR